MDSESGQILRSAVGGWGAAALVLGAAVMSCRSNTRKSVDDHRGDRNLSVSTGLVCTYRPRDGVVDCPRGNLDGFDSQSSLQRLSFHVGAEIEDLEAGPGLACYVKHGGEARCVGDPTWPDVSKAMRRFHVADIDIGTASLVCLAKKGGGVFCGSSLSGESISFDTPHELSHIAVGGDHICGIERSTQLVKCWNLSSLGREKLGVAIEPVGNVGQFDPPSNVRFAEISAGDAHSCGLTLDHELMCWGADATTSADGNLTRDFIIDFGQTKPPRGKFVSVTSGHSHSCALQSNGRVRCWGRNDFGQATPPSSRFVAVDAAGLSTCGITLKGKLVCWGKAKE